MLRTPEFESVEEELEGSDSMTARTARTSDRTSKRVVDEIVL